MRRYLAIIQDPRGYPPPGEQDNEPPEGPEQPMLYTVVKADEHEAEVDRLRDLADAMASAIERRWSGPNGCSCEVCTTAQAWRAAKLTPDDDQREGAE
jgi:hypothetical protein